MCVAQWVYVGENEMIIHTCKLSHIIYPQTLYIRMHQYIHLRDGITWAWCGDVVGVALGEIQKRQQHEQQAHQVGELGEEVGGEWCMRTRNNSKEVAQKTNAVACSDMWCYVAMEKHMW